MPKVFLAVVAADHRDLALEVTPGTSELEKGTKLAGAESCGSAAKAR